MAREINLVPDIKNEMIQALKLRNLIFFVCIVVVIASVGVVVFLGLIIGGQSLALNGKDGQLKIMSEKVNSYGDLSDFLTIKNQLGQLSSISENKKVVSRTFGILSALLPTGADTITISELNIDLSGEVPALTFEAQANAGKAPMIDYNVLDAFKKSMSYMRYDYGRYVDKNGAEIPTYCIVEIGMDGATLMDGEKGVYALWQIDREGCNPSANENQEPEKTEENVNEKKDGEEGQSEDGTAGEDKSSEVGEETATTGGERKGLYAKDYVYEEYAGEMVVRIWRTPQYETWYNDKKMTLEGEISGVQHFNSSCLKYSGVLDNDKNVRWTELNEQCAMVPDGTDGIKVTDSSNGRDTSGELVLRFSANIVLSPEVYKFVNKHMLAVAPSGRHNVTDSYIQVQKMFSKKAEDCLETDAACKTEKEGSN